MAVDRPAFSIMFVCTGNQCRSPMAERLARLAIGRHLGPDAARFKVSSAGTGMYEGRPMTRETATVLESYGADPHRFRSTGLTLERIDAADLILTATRAHRSQVVSLQPQALQRTFTMTEFARHAGAVTTPRSEGLAGGEAGGHDDPVARACALVAEVARSRGSVPPARPEDDDIPDPIGRPLEVYRSVGSMIAAAVDASIAALAGVRV